MISLMFVDYGEKFPTVYRGEKGNEYLKSALTLIFTNMIRISEAVTN